MSGPAEFISLSKRATQEAPLGRRLQTYETDGIVVTYDPNLCIHSGVCVRTLPAVFDPKLKRWVRPENADPQGVAAAVAKCPSRALQSRLK